MILCSPIIKCSRIKINNYFSSSGFMCITQSEKKQLYYILFFKQVIKNGKRSNFFFECQTFVAEKEEISNFDLIHSFKVSCESLF